MSATAHHSNDLMMPIALAGLGITIFFALSRGATTGGGGGGDSTGVDMSGFVQNLLTPAPNNIYSYNFPDVPAGLFNSNTPSLADILSMSNPNPVADSGSGAATTKASLKVGDANADPSVPLDVDAGYTYLDSNGVQHAIPAPFLSSLQTGITTSKKDATVNAGKVSVIGVSGYESQYLVLSNGELDWNTSAVDVNGQPFGLNKKGQVYQRDIDIYDASGKVYDATTGVGDPLRVIDAGYGTFGASKGSDLTSKEISQQITQLKISTPISKKEATVNATASTSSRQSKGGSYNPSSSSGAGGRTSTPSSSKSYNTGGSSGFGGGGAGGR